MRLTLRTLLAYLDDILSPEDAEDLRHKIEESEFASGLVSRIRDVTRRLRLGAPKLEGRGIGLDPNTVAEYLDNTLPPERVPDFEKVCLESDVHLAEVASCHQILTLVLGEPAEVDAASRQRMYGLIALPEQTEVEAADVSGDGAKTAEQGAPQAAPAARRREKPEIPDYLRDDRSRRGWWLLVAASLLVVAGVGIAIVVSTRGTTTVATAPAPQEPGEPAGDPAAAPQATGTEPTATPEPAIDASLPPEPVVPSESVPIPRDPAEEPPAAEQEPPEPDFVPPVVDMPDTMRLPDEVPPADFADEDDAAPIEADRSAVEVGRYVSESEVLLRLDPETGQWRRVMADEAVAAGDRLIVLPGYRAQIELRIGADVQVLGDTRIEVLEVGPDGVPGMALHHGRMVIMPVSKDGAKVRLRLASREGVLSFPDASPIIAASVQPYRNPGTDPETTAPRQIVDLLVAKGSVGWDDAAGGATQTFTAPLRRRLQGALEDQPIDSEVDLPQWVFAPETSHLEQRAAGELHLAISPEKSVRVSLEEQAASPRREVQSLAVRGLASLGEFGPLVASLSDPSQSAAADEHARILRQALARGPEVAQRVRAAIEKHHAGDPAALYRLLWGYTPQQLADGDAAQLVLYLDHKDVAFRVLAFWNLRDITGLGGLYYRPHDGANERQRSVARWQQKLRDGEIVKASSAR